MDEAPTPPLCHVLDAAALADAGDRLVGEPFLHCCTEAQLAFVLARHFAGRSGLVVLRFDPASMPARIAWVRSEPDQDPFPHLYGPLMLDRVTRETWP
jgi:uncharacterized protein (DUF952 family)